MPVQHKNRRGQTFHLHRGKTKSGKPNYFFSLKAEGNPVETIPDGYEVYENPNAQVFLRRKQPKIITDEELALVEKGMNKLSDVKDYILDRRKNAIIVYLADQDVDLFEAILPSLFLTKRQDLENLLKPYVSYSPMMQFILTDKEKREFVAERYCFSGSIDDWINIGGPDRLEKLTKKFLKHLGKDSFFELF